MKICYILMGPSGSGKSTFAEKLKKEIGTTDNIICCADDYHMVDGEYKWKQENQGAAHNYCKCMCNTLMTNGATNVIISNTNTTWKEIKPYVQMAKENG